LRSPEGQPVFVIVYVPSLLLATKNQSLFSKHAFEVSLKSVTAKSPDAPGYVIVFNVQAPLKVDLASFTTLLVPQLAKTVTANQNIINFFIVFFLLVSLLFSE